MFTRLVGAGLGVTTMVASTIVLSMTPALADPANPPVASDIVGVGSDTSQLALDYLADGTTVGGTYVPGYNQKSGVTHFLRTFHADGDPATIVLQQGHAAVTRPNGSGAGLATLYGAGNNPDVDFARSSSAIDSTQASAGLQMFPFALDTLRTAVSQTSNAPASLSISQLVSIYKGDITNWSQVGGTAGVIHPYIPQSGSGTRKFFEAQLKAANGNQTVLYPSSVTETQENTDDDIKNDPNAIVPISSGRANLLGTLTLEGGFKADRALYNVVRQSSVGNSDIQAIFGENGFLCSSAATQLITAGGFLQLAKSSAGGDCGIPTQTPTSNFKTTSGTAVTTTTVTASQPSGDEVDLDAVVSGGPSPAGSVKFTEGTTTLGTVTLTGGHATLALTGVSGGSHTYKATFTPSDTSTYGASSGTVTVTVAQATSVSASVTPANGGYGAKRSVAVVVSNPNGTPTGTVKVTVNGTSTTATLKAGKATVALPLNVPAGTQTVTVDYTGNSPDASTTTSYVVSKSDVKITESFPASVAAGKVAKGTVTVALAPKSTVKPSGSFTITNDNGDVIASGTLAGGKKAVTLPRLPQGSNHLTINYAGTSDTNAGSLDFTITQS